MSSMSPMTTLFEAACAAPKRQRRAERADAHQRVVHRLHNSSSLFGVELTARRQWTPARIGILRAAARQSNTRRRPAWPEEVQDVIKAA